MSSSEDENVDKNKHKHRDRRSSELSELYDSTSGFRTCGVYPQGSFIFPVRTSIASSMSLLPMMVLLKLKNYPVASAYPSEVSRDDLQTLYPLEVSAVVGQELKILMQACGGDQQVKILDNSPSLS